MITAYEAVELLRKVNAGEYRETKFGSCVREFTAIKNVPKYEFQLEAPLRKVVDKPTK